MEESGAKPNLTLTPRLSFKELDDHFARFVSERVLMLSSLCRLFNTLIPRIPGPSAKNKTPVTRFA